MPPFWNRRNNNHDNGSPPAWAEQTYNVLVQMNRLLAQLNNKMEYLQMTLDELQAKADATLAQVTSDTDLDNAVAKVVNDQRATIEDLKTQLAAAGTDPVKLQALSDTMDNILKLDTSNAKIVSDAVTANTTPPAP
jgi:RNA processing factor Prp31